MTMRGRDRGESGSRAWLDVDAELDALLESDSDLAARLNAFKAAATVPPSEEVAQFQIRMMAEAVRLAGSGRLDGKQAPSQRRLTKKRWFGASLAASVGWKIAIASVAVAATTAAATGSLPDPVQSGLSAAASHLGIVLPDGHEGQAGVDQAELTEVQLGDANQAGDGQPIELNEPDNGQSDQGDDGQASQP